MEISDVKRRVVETIESAKRLAAERRTRTTEATRAYEQLLERIAIPLFKQVSNVLRAQGLTLTVFTPGGSVRLTSDRSAEDYIELTLDTSGDQPTVTGSASRSRGRRVLATEQALGAPEQLTEEDILRFLLAALVPFVER
jgi:hypothetical protein